MMDNPREQTISHTLEKTIQYLERTEDEFTADLIDSDSSSYLDPLASIRLREIRNLISELSFASGLL